MCVVRNNKNSICSKSTIHKFVIIMISCYKIQMKLRVNKLHKFALHDSINNILSNYRTSFSGNYLLIFLQYFI